MFPLDSVPFFEKAYYIKKEHYSNFCTFEIASLVNVPGHYLRKYGILKWYSTTEVILFESHFVHVRWGLSGFSDCSSTSQSDFSMSQGKRKWPRKIWTPLFLLIQSTKNRDYILVEYWNLNFRSFKKICILHFVFQPKCIQ